MQRKAIDDILVLVLGFESKPNLVFHDSSKCSYCYHAFLSMEVGEFLVMETSIKPMVGFGIHPKYHFGFGFHVNTFDFFSCFFKVLIIESINMVVEAWVWGARQTLWFLLLGMGFLLVVFLFRKDPKFGEPS